MISRDVIQKICEAGAQAPSGSNSQPWRFEVRGETVSVIMLPKKDHPILNARRGGTLIAHGALLENISIAAEHFGFHADIILFPDNENQPNLVARITFKEDTTSEKLNLFDAIWRRATNRKPYAITPLTPEVRQKINEISVKARASGVSVAMIDRPEDIKKLARAAATNEEIMFGNADLRSLFFKEIVWTNEEEKKRGGGLYVPTMELTPQQQTGVKLLRNPIIGRLLVALGIPRKIAAENAEGYAACAGYGAIVCGAAPEDFVNAGRVIERMWLMATALGLSFHLQTGVNFLWLASRDGNGIFSKNEVRLIEEAYEAIKDIGNAGEKFIPALFRIGQGSEPTARSIKLAPQIQYVS